MSPQARLGGGTVCWAGKGAGLGVPCGPPEKASVPYDRGAGRTKASLVVLVVKNPPANSGDIRDPGSIPRSGRSSEEGNGNPLQYSCLEHPMDRGAWQATAHGVAELDTTEAT